jgi:nucleotide-binding universal stress UspA family protein
MKKIIVPCDFSKPAVNAFRFALDIAEQSRGKVYLLHVIELPVMYDSVLMPSLYFENDLYKELKENAEKQFKKLLAKYPAEVAKVNTEVTFGPIYTLIINCAKEKEADLIVMGTQGANGLKEIFIGSNAEKIVRTSPVPVIVLKNNFKGPINNIVFPNVLEQEGQEDLVLKVKALQNFYKAHLNIVWINTPLNFSNDKVTRAKLEAFAKRFMLKNYSLHIYNYTDGEEGILHFANEINADMIAIGTHGRRGLNHLLKGSLTENLVNHSNYMIWTSVMKDDNEHNDA